MMLMSVFDISQLVVHFITGFFNIFQSTGAYWFAKVNINHIKIFKRPRWIEQILVFSDSEEEDSE